MERAYRWLSITWFGSGSSVGSHWWQTTQRVVYFVYWVFDKGFYRRLKNSQRCPCPCWAAPAAGVEVRQEDASSCLQVWSGRRPAGTDQEVSSTNLPNKYLKDNVVFPENRPLNLTWWLTQVSTHKAQFKPGGVTSGAGKLSHIQVLNLGGKFYLRSSNKSKFLWSGVHLHYMFICLVMLELPRGSDTVHRCGSSPPLAYILRE